MTNGKLKRKRKADKCASTGKVSMVASKKISNQSFIHIHILLVVVPGINKDKSSTLTSELPNLFFAQKLDIHSWLFEEYPTTEVDGKGQLKVGGEEKKETLTSSIAYSSNASVN